MKKYLFFDSAKCSACGACALACIDQNDVDVAGGQQPFRHTFTLENKQGDLSFYSVSCMHCADAPCVTGCPRGCLTKDAETGFTLYDTPTASAAAPAPGPALTACPALARTARCASATPASSASAPGCCLPASRSAPRALWCC